MKKLVALLLALTLVVSVACADVLVTWYTMGDTFLASVRTSLEAAFDAKGVKAVPHDANGVQQAQTDTVATAAMMYQGVAINLVESSNVGAAEAVCMAMQQGGSAPFIFFNRSLAETDDEAQALCEQFGTYYVGTQAEEAGMMEGTMVGEFLLANYDAVDLNGDGVITYVMLKGDEANQEAIYRTKYGVENADAVLTAAGKPALQYYDANASTKYLVDQNGTWSRVAGQEYMDAILAQYSEESGNMVELVIANNDEMAIGAIQALQAKGYNDGKGKVIPVFGVDATSDAKDMIAKGFMTGTIKQDAEGMADAVATILVNMVNGADPFEGLNETYHIVDGWRINIPYSAYTGE